MPLSVAGKEIDMRPNSSTTCVIGVPDEDRKVTIFSVIFILYLSAVLLLPVNTGAQGPPNVDWMRGGNVSGLYNAAYLDNARFLTLSDHTLKVFRADDGMLLTTIPLDGTSYWFEMSADRSLIAINGPELKVLRTSDFAVIQTFSTVYGDYMRFSPDGQFVAVGLQNSVQLWSVATGELVATYSSIAGKPSFSSDGQLLAGQNPASSLYGIRLVRVSDGVVVKDYANTYGGPRLFPLFAPDGQHLVASDGSSFHVWRLTDACATFTSCAPVASLGVGGPWRGFVFSADGSKLGAGYLQNGQATNSVWDATAWAQGESGFIRSYVSNAGETAPAIAFSLDGTEILSAAQDIEVWSVADGSLTHNYDVFGTRVNALAYSPNGQLIATGSEISYAGYYDGGIRVWNAIDGSLVRKIDFGVAGRTTVYSVSFSPDGQLLAVTGAGSNASEVKLFDVNSGNLVRTLTGVNFDDCAAVFSPDGNLIATEAPYPNAILLFNVSDGSLVRTMAGTQSCGMSFSPDGTRITNGRDVFRVSDGTRLFNIGNSSTRTNGTSYSPDGRFIATVTGGNGILIFDAASGTLLRTLTGHTGPTSAVAFTPDSQALISGADDQTLRFWNVETGALIRTYDEETGASWQNMRLPGVAFSPDGSSFAYVRRIDASLVKAANPLYVPVDTTPPVIEESIFPSDPSWIHNGWYGDSDVIVSWQVYDGESAITSTSGCDTTEIYEDTTGLTLTCTASSSGGTSTKSVTIRRDVTAPSLNCQYPDGIWHGTDVSLTCAPVDLVSGLAVPSQSNVLLSTSVPAGSETSDAVATIPNNLLCDNAGNCVFLNVYGNRIDKKAPIAVVYTPISSTYLLNEVVPVSYNCIDGGSGVYDCPTSSLIAGNLDTSSTGPKTLTVSATDQVGNVSLPASADYSVRYQLLLFYDASKELKINKSVAIKVGLADASGTNMSSANVPLTVVSLTRISPSPAQMDITDIAFRYARQGYYTANISTKGLTAGTYEVGFTAGPDTTTTYSVTFSLK